DDDLMRLFGGEKMQNIIGKLGVEEDEAIEAGLLTKSIEGAQKKVEGRNYGIRKYVLQYDDVMNRQRSIIYSQRNKVLMGEDLREHILSMMQDHADELADFASAVSKYPEEWDFEDLNRKLKSVSQSLPELHYTEEQLQVLDRGILASDIMDLFDTAYRAKEEEIGAERMRELERMILLRIVDNKWMDHIDAMDQLKTGIGLRSLGQQDPAAAYANEGFDMFEYMIKSINDEMIRFCFNVTVQTRSQRREILGSGAARKDEVISALQEGKQSPPQAGSPVYTVSGGLHGVDSNSTAAPPKPVQQAKPQPVKVDKKPGRNDPCPCGSGKKYKKCCGR
ncbi:MAG TPA: SEC-C metal-binding domain-containing protein, partial [Anaerovoracaceae bacterium]|nr:SEC-C metal-binding domain-containing protein [Anaerovoracaceae bacterium]